ncbi:MAG: hypothetical protein WBB28_19460 [Crinalium sp.]
MNLELNPKVSGFSLLLLWLAYALLGWSLAAHHIVWIVGLFIAFIAFYLVKKVNPLLVFFINVCSQNWFLLLSSALLFSILVAAIATSPLVITLVIIPLVSTILVEIEMRFSGLNQFNKILIFTSLAGLGLAVGEAVDLILLPSMRY